MDMRAHLLTSFSGTKYSDDGNFGFFVKLGELDIVPEEGVKSRGCSMVIVYTIKSHTKKVHV